jgi:hypothetical protein
MRKKTPTSGNGSPRRQWLYLYINFPVFFLVKIGITGDRQRRRKEVNRSTFGWTLPVFAVRVPFAWQCEQAMHRLFSWFNVPFGGSREWFLLPVAPVAIGLMALAWALEWGFWVLLAAGAVWWMYT